MFLLRTFCCVKMNAMNLWVVALTLQTLLLTASCGNHNPKHRRSMGTQGSLPMSKGGWRPVVGSSGLLYGSFGTPLHSQAYKIPIPIMDFYQPSSRPNPAKDSNKLTSIAQSYRPTTLRTVSSAPAVPIAHQPINSYYNPFAFQNNAFANYKFIPAQSAGFRNPYAERNIYSKYPTKLKQNTHLQNPMSQQLTNIQPIYFGQYQSVKPAEILEKPIQTYVRPNDGKKTQSTTIETFKPEVFKLDNDAAPQSVNQQVKTAQQHGLVGQSNIGNPYPQYSFQDPLQPPNIIGTFGSFGIQSVKARDPVYQYPTTFGPAQQTKTIFNSYSYTPSFKTTPAIFDSTTPRAPTTANQNNYLTTYSDLKITPAPQAKVRVPPKIDPNAELKDGFKPSQQDPFSNKLSQSDFNKLYVTTYNPVVSTTTLGGNYYDYHFPIYQNPRTHVHQNQQNSNFNYENKISLTHDSITAGNQQPVPIRSHSETVKSSYRPAYEVTEALELDPGTKSSSAAWPVTPVTYDYNQKSTEESEKEHKFVETLSKPETTFTSDVPEEYAIVTEAEKGHGNSLSYDGEVESQSRRPSGDDFEPISVDKLKDYYYKVSTPIYDDYSTSKRTRPTESVKYTTQQFTTQFNNDKEITAEQLESLPTVPTTEHFKRPTSTEPNERDRVRKRNKIRRRRPPLANINRNKEETSTDHITSTVSATEAPLTTRAEEVYTIRPRIRTTKLTTQPNLTTPTVTTDLTTSALPTISPTIPTIVKKKLTHRRPITTTTARPETTTLSTIHDDVRKESQVMKITSRPYLPRSTNEVRNDFTHKQDEKDSPTSDVEVNLSNALQSTVESEQDFSFHKDVKPIEAKLEPVTNLYKETTTDTYKEENSDYTTTPHAEYTTTDRYQRPRLRNKFNRNNFNVKEYKNRISATTTNTDKPTETTPKVRFPVRRVPYFDIETETTTERKKFTPKEPRYKIGNGTENNGQTEKNTHTFKPSRQRQTTTDVPETTTVKLSSRVRNGQRRPRPPEETTETSSPTTIYSRRPLRKKIQDSEVGESVQDITIAEIGVNDKNDITSERTRAESAIMKIADKKHHEHLEHLFEHSKRVSDLTLAASKDYNKPGMFKTVSSNSRRIPNYFTIATDDPILPIEAFFPQLNQKRES